MLFALAFSGMAIRVSPATDYAPVFRTTTTKTWWQQSTAC
jgi:hypothetical protein